jgi:hypothetical protein
MPIEEIGLNLYSGRARFEFRTLATLTDDFNGFPQPLKTNFGIVLRLKHNCFLPNPSQFIIYQSSF